MWRAPCIAVLLALVPPLATAHAGAAIVDSDPVSEATWRAARFWGATPCAGSVEVVGGPDSEAPPAGANAPSPYGSRAAMWASWQTPLGANSFAAPPASFTACVVHVNTVTWPSWRVDDEDFAAFCKEMVHEYGHLEGHPDVGAAPGTVEYERPDLARVPLCERYRLRFAHTVYTPRSGRRPRRRHPPRARARGSVRR